MEFEKQIVRINLDKYKSHRPGLLPFIRFNSENTAIETVADSAYNGNYGQFVCDLSGSTFSVRYSDIISRYNEMQNMLSESVFAEKISRVVANEQAKNCGYENQTPTRKEACLSRISRYPLSAYEFFPVSLSGFTNEGNYFYLKDTESTLLQGHEMFVILPDYERYREIEDWWKSKMINYYGQDAFNSEFFFCRVVEHDFLGLITVPEKDENQQDIDGIRVPGSVYKQEIPEIVAWFNENMKSGDAEVARAVNERGGAVFKNFLSNTLQNWSTSGSGDVVYTVPSLYLHTILTQECDYAGVYENYNDSMEVFNNAAVAQYLAEYQPHSANGESITQLTGWWEKDASGASITADSKLSEVISKNAVTVGGVVGVWEECNKIYTATYKTGSDFSTIPANRIFVISAGTEDNMSWWEFVETDTANKTLYCDDGGSGTASTSNSIYYRTIPTFGCVNGLFRTAPAANSVYYFLVKKDNGGLKKEAQNTPLSACTSTAFKIPFVQGSISNIREVGSDIYRCNYVALIAENDDDSLTIEYVIDGRANKNENVYTYVDKTGTRYREKFRYHKNQVMLTNIDSYYDVDVYYDELDMDGAKQKIVNTDYGFERVGNVAEIIGMEVGSIFTQDGTIVAPIFTRDTAGSLMEEPKVKFNLIIDRGMAAAFERHFKLGECNSFEDLQNYGNNYFNL